MKFPSNVLISKSQSWLINNVSMCQHVGWYPGGCLFFQDLAVVFLWLSFWTSVHFWPKSVCPSLLCLIFPTIHEWLIQLCVCVRTCVCVRVHAHGYINIEVFQILRVSSKNNSRRNGARVGCGEGILSLFQGCFWKVSQSKGRHLFLLALTNNRMTHVSHTWTANGIEREVEKCMSEDFIGKNLPA